MGRPDLLSHLIFISLLCVQGEFSHGHLVVMYYDTHLTSSGGLYYQLLPQALVTTLPVAMDERSSCR
jgi:hypothetical protein